jgi:hypothetical protein
MQEPRGGGKLLHVDGLKALAQKVLSRETYPEEGPFHSKKEGAIKEKESTTYCYPDRSAQLR